MIEAALGTNQLTLPALQQGPAIHAVLPVVDGIRLTGVWSDITLLVWFLLIHTEKYARCRGLSRIRHLSLLPCEAQESNADSLHRSHHVVRLPFCRHLREIKRGVVVG